MHREHTPSQILFANPYYHVLWLLFAMGFGSFAVSDEKPAREIVLVGGKIATQTTAGVIEGSILIRNGQIAGIGKIDIPSDAQRIEIPGMVVTPGLIDARSCLWLTTDSARDGAADGGLDALDGVDPFSEDWKEVVRQGVTSVYVQPGPTGICGGRGVVLQVGPGRSADKLLIKADAGAQASLGRSARSVTSRDRYAEYEQLKKVLESAKQYDETWKKYEAAKKAPMETQKDATAKGSSAAAAKAPPRDPAKDFLRKVLNRTVPLRMDAHREDCLARALQLADEFGIRLVLDGVSHPLASLDNIRSRRIPLVLGPVIEMGDVPEYRKQRPADWLPRLAQEDVRWALATFGQHPRESRLLRVQAAAAVALGVPPEQVLRAITLNAAAILGVEDKLGSIAVGKQADLAVFAGDPLNPSIPVRLVISRGQVVYQAELSAIAASPEKREAVTVNQPLPATYALKSSRCWTENGMLEPRTILVADGRVVAVHSEANPMAQVPVVDVGSAVITPGLVNGHSDLGFGPAIDEPFDADASYLRAVDVFDRAALPVRQAARDGFLGLAFAPGSSNVLAGSVGVVRPGATDSIRQDFLAGKFVLTASSRNSERYPVSLAGQFEVIDQVLSAKPVGSNLFVPGQILEQLDSERHRHTEALKSGQRVAMFEAQAEAEIEAALQLIGKYKLRGVLVGSEEMRSFLPEIKRLKVGIVARPVRAADFDRYVDSLAEASRAGIPIAFGLGSGEHIRISAALAVNAGMPHNTALLALTSGAAQLLGMPAGIGQIEPGQPADLVIWSGSPLDLASKPWQVIVDGQVLESTKPTSKKKPAGEQRLANQAE